MWFLHKDAMKLVFDTVCALSAKNNSKRQKKPKENKNASKSQIEFAVFARAWHMAMVSQGYCVCDYSRASG